MRSIAIRTCTSTVHLQLPLHHMRVMAFLLLLLSRVQLRYVFYQKMEQSYQNGNTTHKQHTSHHITPHITFHTSLITHHPSHSSPAIDVERPLPETSVHCAGVLVTKPIVAVGIFNSIRPISPAGADTSCVNV